MAFGFQVFDPQGRLIVDITDRLTRIIGQVYTGDQPGSIQVPGWASYGTPWVFVLQRPNASFTPLNGTRFVRPTISGDTLSWDFEPNSPSYNHWPRIPGTIQYGVY